MRLAGDAAYGLSGVSQERKALNTLLIIITLLLFLATHAQAIVDDNNNGVSDLWEKHYNSGALFTDFDPQADPDGDGWTNAREAAAGTDPFDANPPGGFIQPRIASIPAVYTVPGEEEGEPELVTPGALTVAWPTLAGKQYTLLCSPD